MIGAQITGSSYTYSYPRHPGCPGRKRTCPDCGQEYHETTPVYPYQPGPTWVVPPPWSPGTVICKTATSGVATVTS